MGTRRSRESAIPYGSEAYKAHACEFADLCDKAERLNLVTSNELYEIVGPQGVVCNRAEGDDRASVTSVYFEAVVENNHQLPMPPEKPFGKLLEQRQVLRRVLAAHLSVQEQKLDDPRDPDSLPINAYEELITATDEHCHDHHIPPVLANMFTPRSLFKRLMAPEFGSEAKRDISAIRGLFRQLVYLYIAHDKYLHTIITALTRQGHESMAVELIEEAAAQRADKVVELFKANPLLLTTCTQVLLQHGKHEEILQRCTQVGMNVVMASAPLQEHYIRALHELQRTQELIAFINSTESSGVTSPHLEKAKSITSVAAGHWFLEQGKYDEGRQFLEKHVIGEFWHKNVQDLWAKLAAASQQGK